MEDNFDFVFVERTFDERIVLQRAVYNPDVPVETKAVEVRLGPVVTDEPDDIGLLLN